MQDKLLRSGGKGSNTLSAAASSGCVADVPGGRGSNTHHQRRQCLPPRYCTDVYCTDKCHYFYFHFLWVLCGFLETIYFIQFLSFKDLSSYLVQFSVFWLQEEKLSLKGSPGLGDLNRPNCRIFF